MPGSTVCAGAAVPSVFFEQQDFLRPAGSAGVSELLSAAAFDLLQGFFTAAAFDLLQGFFSVAAFDLLHGFFSTPVFTAGALPPQACINENAKTVKSRQTVLIIDLDSF